MKPQDEYIDMTPTWAEILGTLLLLLEKADKDGRATARAELLKMARVADVWNAHGQELIDAGRALMLDKRNISRLRLTKAIHAAELAAHNVKRGA